MAEQMFGYIEIVNIGYSLKTFCV